MLDTCNVTKKLRHKCFLVNFLNFLATIFLQEAIFPQSISGWQYLRFYKRFSCVLLIVIFIRDGQIFGGKKIEALDCKTERIKERKRRNTKKIKLKNFHLYYFFVLSNYLKILSLL